MDYLEMESVPVSDLGPLAGLARLSALKVTEGQVRDIGPLEDLAELSYVDLRGNLIEDLDPLVQNRDFGDGDRVALPDVGNDALHHAALLLERPDTTDSQFDPECSNVHFVPRLTTFAAIRSSRSP